MRKTSKPFFLSFFLSFFLLILLTSCENFMQGGEVADSITDHINYMNSPAFSVRIAPEEIEHGIVVSGISKEKVRVTDEFEIIFSKNADYTFLGWDAVKKDDHNISYNQYVKFEQTSALSTTVKIIGGNEDIYSGQLQLRPLCRPVSRGKINITSSYGTVSYNCEDEYKEGTPLKLSISPNPGYGFTHWIVMVGDEYDESGEYVVIDDSENPITDATFLKCPEDENEIIYIIPECIDRPVIISNTPYGSDSFSSDSRIKVLFDSPMDEDSLYFTIPEIKTLGSGITELYSTLKPGKIYGYEKDGKQYYKNIIVTDRDTNKSLLEYFGEPRFTTPDMLVIPTDSSKPLPKNTEIIVNISSNFSTKTEAGYSVSLDGKKIWNYMVNGESDKDKPAWSDSYPKVEAVDGVFKKRDGTVYTEYNWDGVWSALTGDTTNKYSSAVSNNTYFVRNNKLKINAEFSDTGTGPSSLTLYLQRVNSSSYTDITTKNLPIRITGNKAFYQKNGEGVEVDLTGPNNQKLPDGAYRVWLRAEDDAGNHADSKYFYVYLDTTNTQTSKPVGATATENSITFDNIPNASSSNYLFYQMKKAGEEYKTPIRITTTSKTISSLAAGTSYEFKFFLCDDFGNSNYNVEFTKNTQPSKPLNVTMAKDESNQTKINISLKKNSDPNYKGASVTINQFNPETGNTTSSQQISSGTKTITIPLEENKDTYTGSFTSLQPGYRYVITASAYDSGDDYNQKNESSGETAKVSSGSATSLVLNPAPLTNLAVNESSTGNGKVKVSWNLPAQSFINAYNLYYKDAANSSASWTTTPLHVYGQNKNNEEVTLPDAATGKKLKFKLESAVVNSTNHSTEYAKSSSAPEYEYFVPPKNLVSFAMDSKTNTSVTFKWTNPNTTYDGIKIGYKASSASSYTYFDVDKTKTSYTIQNLSNSTQYYFSYYTYTNNGNSIVKSITTSAGYVTTRPNPVTNLKATPLSGSQIKLTWTKPTGTYTGIKLYKKVKTDSNYTELRTIASNTSTEYTWTLSDIESAYVYDVVAVSYYSDTNNTSAETAITANSSIDPVTNFKVSSTTKNSITVSWTNPATAYDTLILSYTKAGGTTETETLSSKTLTSKTISSLSAGSSYNIKLQTKVTKNSQAYTQDVSLNQYTRPNAVTNIKVERNSTYPNSQLDISWTKPSEASGVCIFYSTGTDLSKAACGGFVTNKTSSTIKNLTPGTKYNFWVVSYAGAAPDYSDIQNGTSLNTTTPAAYASCYTKPNEITEPAVTATTKTSATLSWKKASKGTCSGYKIYVQDITGGQLSLNYNSYVSSPDETTIIISNLTAGHKYKFDIRAYAATAYNSTDSNEAYSTSTTVQQSIRPNAVTGVSVSRSSSNTMTKLYVSWAKPASGTYTGACIFYSTGTKLSEAKFAGDTVYTDYTITGLTGGTNYNVWVVAYAGTVPDSSDITKGTSLNTTEAASVSCYTSPYSPAGLSCTSKTQTSVSLSWTKPSTGSVTGYRVYKKDITAGASSYTYVNYTTSTSYNVSVTAGHKYSFKVTSYLDTTSNESTPGATIECYAKAPTCNFVVSPDTNAPNTTQILSWTWPESGRSDMWLYIYIGTSSTFTNSTLVASKSKDDGTSLSYSSLYANTNYYWWIVTYVGDKLNDPNPSTINGKTDAYIGSSKSKKTAPNAPTGLKLWMDDGMGRVKFTWTKPASCDSLKLAIGSTSYTFTGSDSGWIDISNYSRSSSYSISLKAYNSEDLASLAATMTYSNTSGNLVIEGIQYSYSACNNVCTSATSVTKSSEYRWTASGDERHYSSFSSNSENGGSGSVSIPEFSMGAYEVNRKLFKAVTGSDPSNFNDGYTQSEKDVRPVENLNVYQAMLFCNKLSTLFGYTPYYKVYVSNSYETDWSFSTSDSSYSGFVINAPSSLGFRLPSKAMWEFAARGGNPDINSTDWMSYYSGAKNKASDATYRNRVAWNNSNASPKKPNYVYWDPGTYAPNSKSLYNMSGNVWEMTDTIYSKNTSEVVSMGGSFDNDTRCAVDSIFTQTKAAEDNKVGFRMCRNKTVNP